MRHSLAAALLLLIAPAALAERPADVLARLRGVPSTNTGALGSAAPAQFVDAYRNAFPPPPILLVPGHPPRHHGWPFAHGPGVTVGVGVHAGPVSLSGVLSTGGGAGSVACPASSWPTSSITTTTITTTTVTTTGGSPGIILAAPDPESRERPRSRTIAVAREEP